MPDLGPFTPAPVVAEGKPLFTGAVAPSPQPGRPESADVSTAGHSGQIIHLAQHTELSERLQQTEVERRAADAAARQGQPETILWREGNPRLARSAGHDTH